MNIYLSNIKKSKTFLCIFYKKEFLEATCIKFLCEIFPDYYDINSNLFTIPLNLIINKKYKHLFTFQITNLSEVQKIYKHYSHNNSTIDEDDDNIHEYFVKLKNKNDYFEYILKYLPLYKAIIPYDNDQLIIIAI